MLGPTPSWASLNQARQPRLSTRDRAALMTIISFPNQKLRKRVPDEVGVVFDMGRWSAALYSEGRLVRRLFCDDYAAAVAKARQIAADDGLTLQPGLPEAPC